MTPYQALQALPAFQEAIADLDALEQDRPFCGHGLSHAMDVARLAWIEVLEKGLDVRKDHVYLTALLHDLGRIDQYRQGTPHDQAGLERARDLLDQIAYPEDLRPPIYAAIAGHRSGDTPSADPFVDLMTRADKASRPCFSCPAADDCYWPPEKKNPSFSS